MGNSPSEAKGVTCSNCHRRLPGTNSWGDIEKKKIDRKIDQVWAFEFQKGKYYRIERYDPYYCPECFWKPKRDHEELQRQQEEERRREAAHKEEEARKEEKQKRQAHKMQLQAELAQREQEAKGEAKRLEVLRKKEQEERRKLLEEENKKKAETHYEIPLSKDTSLSKKFVTYTHSKCFRQTVHTESYRPFEALTSSTVMSEDEMFDDPLSDDELSSDFEGSSGDKDEASGLLENASSTILDMKPDEELDIKWLNYVQTLLVTHYSQINDLSSLQIEILIEFLSDIQSGLSGKESLSLAKTLVSLRGIRHSDLSELEKLPLTCKFSRMLLDKGRYIYSDSSQWMQRCFSTFISAMIPDNQLQAMFVEMQSVFSSKSWSTHECFCLIEQFKTKSVCPHTQKHLLLLTQAYHISPLDLYAALEEHDPPKVLKEKAREEPDKLLVDVLSEMRASELDEALLCQMKEIVLAVNEMLAKKNIKLDYKKFLGARYPKEVVKSAAGFEDVVKTSSAIFIIMCAVYKEKGFCPRETQLVALVVLLLSGAKRVSMLLEVLTGEGKSCIIAMFAAFLGVQGKHVDIITSSPLLAHRDAMEWSTFYSIFGLKATHNTDVSRSLATHITDDYEDKRICYRHNIVYGTISDFSADILRDEFEQKNVRCGRPFDAVIVDEVDLLMLDEGIQFTYLSHNASVLHHIEPVVASVWAVIGPFRPATTSNGKLLYAGSQKLFTEVVFENLDPIECELEGPDQLLAIARDSNVITDDQFQILTRKGVDDKDIVEHMKARTEVINSLTIEDCKSLFAVLDDYIPNMPVLELYLVNEEGSLVGDQTARGSEEASIKLLLLGCGMATTLNTLEELTEGGALKVKNSLQFSDEVKDGDKDKPQVKLPRFLEEFVMDQIPTYIDNAIRALQMLEDREYAISKEGKIIPVDFQNSGMMEMKKKWGGGLQQMLEMKHNLSLSSMSVVTNFMSNTELFSRYMNENGNGNIYGLSGTLGLDSADTKMALQELFGVQVSSIPTHKVRKLYERPEIIIEGGDTEWFEEITVAVSKAIKKEPWKMGRAVLILCEDIKTAEDLKAYILKKEEWKGEDGTVHLYAHSNSSELHSIDHEFKSGEMVIATNLAGRGTNIMVSDEVNQSGGLLCLLTFLPRNRRVELQAFGRTGRKGTPGSVQCIIKASTLPFHYRGLDLHSIRKLRGEEETIRLKRLLKCDVREVKLRQKLFKSYCKFLQDVRLQMGERDDKAIVVTSLNERWGEWLQMMSDRVERLDGNLEADLSRAQEEWRPNIPSDPRDPVHLKVRNFYHLIKFGNQLLIKQDKENAQKASWYFTESIKLEPSYAAIAYYNRAYCTIVLRGKDYKCRALEDLEKAVKCLEPYIVEVASVLQCVTAINYMRRVKPTGSIPDETASGSIPDHDKKVCDYTLSSQMQMRLQILDFVKNKIQEMIDIIKQYQENKDDIEAKPLGIFSLVPNADYITNKELTLLWSLGLEVVYSIEKKPKFCWSGLTCFIMGIAQLAAGVLLTVFTVGTAATIGMTLISEGISDCISGIEGMVTGKFSWVQYAISKSVGIAISLASGGITHFTSKAGKAAKFGSKLLKVGSKLGKELKAIPMIAKNTWGQAAQKNLKMASKYVIKEAAIAGISHVQSKGLNKVFEKGTKAIGGSCKKSIRKDLDESLAKGYLGAVVDQRFMMQMPDACGYCEKAPDAINFFSDVADRVVRKHQSCSKAQKRIASTCLSLFSQVSDSCKKGEVKCIALTLELATEEVIFLNAAEEFDNLVVEFIPEMETMCREFFREEGVVISEKEHKSLQCAAGLKKKLSEHVGEVFANAVTTLLQQNLGSVVNHELNRAVNSLTSDVLRKHIFKSQYMLSKIQAAQHANYIRSVEIGSSSHSEFEIEANQAMVDNYAKYVENPNNPGSLMEIRGAAEKYGREIVILVQKKDGQLVQDCSISSPTKNTNPKLEIIFTPPKGPNSAGHYDAKVDGKIVRIEATSKNCLFAALACGLSGNARLTGHQLELNTQRVRQAVADTFKDNPHSWAGHIKHRLQMSNLRKANYFAMIGAGPSYRPLNIKTKVLPKMYKQAAIRNKRLTMYRQENGLVHKAVETYKLNLNGTVPGEGNKLMYMRTETHGMKLTDKRCFHTLPSAGQLRRKGGKRSDSTHSAHLASSRGGANAGDVYANSVLTSRHYNHLMDKMWTAPLIEWIGNHPFSQTTVVNFGPVVPEEPDRFLKDMEKSWLLHTSGTRKGVKSLLPKRYLSDYLQRCKLFQHIAPNSRRVESLDITLTLPQTTTVNQQKIEMAATLPTVVDWQKRTVTTSFGPDYYLHTVDHDYWKTLSHGELYPGEISGAINRVKNRGINVPPRYRKPPADPNPESVQEFHADYEEFIKDQFI